MFCRNCANETGPGAVICVRCGVPVGQGYFYCPNCAVAAPPGAAVCMRCGCSLVPVAAGGGKSKMAAGLLAILLSVFGFNFGVHNFYLGYTGKAVTQLCLNVGGWIVYAIVNIIIMPIITALTMGFGAVFYVITAIPLHSTALLIWGVIEGVIILSGRVSTDANGNLLE